MLKGNKIWFDLEEPKTAIMFKSLIDLFHQNQFETMITARDYDSTFQILDNIGFSYHKVGEHGGDSLESKLKSYIDRLPKLFKFVSNFKPDYFVTFSSVEGARISYGLNLPSIGYNDEPRNIPVCKLIFPFLDKIITPKCVPEEWYLSLHAETNKLIRYNGIDEIAWLSNYQPNPKILDVYDLKKGEYVLLRTEPSFASYFIDKLDPSKTLISEFLPDLIKSFPNYKFIVIARTNKQESYLKQKLMGNIKQNILRVTQFMPNIADLCFFSALVISGGGTIVRESSLLGVPSIEFFPGDTAPQEHFLINNGFPLVHLKNADEIRNKSLEILSKGLGSERFSLSFRDKIKDYENPNEICYKLVQSNLLD